MSVDIYRQLEETFRRVFNDDTIVLTPETTADDVPGWDSISYINLIVSIEHTFGVQFTSAELSSFRNVGELVDRLEEKGVRVQ